ncbi:hypothetical protein Cph01nite_07700 [Cellulomonas phragmiteti]|uniref:Uncharacterized protein n=1 Tax=Cellulomonas phragmiteti TaxID=478780 RepID=A0ABQ4DI32_9CELL|nr:hypothetical protein Cph01nite_07700 [Cellulomonas phragmiteti]
MRRARDDDEVAVTAGREEPPLVPPEVVVAAVDEPDGHLDPCQVGDRVRGPHGAHRLPDHVVREPAGGDVEGALRGQHAVDQRLVDRRATVRQPGEEAVGEGPPRADHDRTGPRAAGRGDEPDHLLRVARGVRDRDVAPERQPDHHGPSTQGVDRVPDRRDRPVPDEGLGDPLAVARQVDRDRGAPRALEGLELRAPHRARRAQAVDEQDGRRSGGHARDATAARPDG